MVVWAKLDQMQGALSTGKGCLLREPDHAPTELILATKDTI